MLKRVMVIGLLGYWVIGLAGCATARKHQEMEMQGLKNQVSVLESQLQGKDEEVSSLRDALTRANEEKEEASSLTAKVKSIGEVKSRPNVKQVQIALANAGYNSGAIDGKMGKLTREAIKVFQKDKGLVVDGKVGKKTWELLKDYLYKKIK